MQSPPSPPPEAAAAVVTVENRAQARALTPETQILTNSDERNEHNLVDLRAVKSKVFLKPVSKMCTFKREITSLLTQNFVRSLG